MKKKRISLETDRRTIRVGRRYGALVLTVLACAALTILAMACGSEPFGYDYLYPLMPPGKAVLRDGFVRAIWSRLAQKGEVLPRHAKE